MTAILTEVWDMGSRSQAGSLGNKQSPSPRHCLRGNAKMEVGDHLPLLPPVLSLPAYTLTPCLQHLWLQFWQWGEKRSSSGAQYRSSRKRFATLRGDVSIIVAENWCLNGHLTHVSNIKRR